MTTASAIFGGLFWCGGCLYYGLKAIADAMSNRRVDVNVPPVVVTLGKPE